MIHALYSAAIAFAVALAVGKPLIDYMRSVKAGKRISADQPASHQVKAGTPTFGGLIIWLPTFLVSVFAVDWWEHQSILLPVGMITVMVVTGFVDDLGTLQDRGRGGLSWRFKTSLLLVLSCAAAWGLYEYVEVQSINVPYVGKYELGLFYLPIAVLTIVATTSAVAVTDGLDTLAGGTTLIAFVAFGIIAFIQQQTFVATFALIIAGANLGFVWYNAHPARIFMGDTGALALGSGLSIVALMTGHWLLLPVIGLWFVIEAASNVIQIGYYKISGGKRFFRRAPFHHHLEEIGWAETQVVTRAWVLSIVAAMIGVALAMEVPS